MITREDLIKADHLRLEGADVFPDLWEIAEKLIEERDEALNWKDAYEAGENAYLSVERQRNEALKRIEDFKRHVIPCVICEYKEGVLITRCRLHEKLEESLANLECAKKEMMAALDRMNEERRWKEAYREVAVNGTSMRTYEATDAEAKRIFEEGK